MLLHHLKLQKVRVNMSAKNEHEKNCVPLCATFILIEIQKRARENENKLLFNSYPIYFGTRRVLSFQEIKFFEFSQTI